MFSLLNSQFSSFKIIKFLTIIIILFYVYYLSIYNNQWQKLLFGSFNKRETILYLSSIFVSTICYFIFTFYIYNKTDKKTSVVNTPMESEGQFYYLVAYSVLLLCSLLFIPFVFHYATSSPKSIDVSYIIQSLLYLILISTVGIILLFNNTKYDLKNKKDKIIYAFTWVSLVYFFIQVSFIDIGFWTPKFLS